MAESVDALVSNTSGAIRAGSTPALGTNKRLSAREPFLFSNACWRQMLICKMIFFASVCIFFVKLFAKMKYFSYLCAQIVYMCTCVYERL